jgi:hypothetical protein
MLPLSSGLKCIGSGIDLAVEASYKEGECGTRGEEVKKI